VPEPRGPYPPPALNIDHDLAAGTLAARRDLGPESEAAVIAAFLERTGRAIDARVDQRLAQHSDIPRPERGGRDNALRLALGSIALGIPATGVATSFPGAGGVLVAFATWGAIAVVNAVYSRNRNRS
jgi:hypothetical protein